MKMNGRVLRAFAAFERPGAGPEILLPKPAEPKAPVDFSWTILIALLALLAIAGLLLAITGFALKKVQKDAMEEEARRRAEYEAARRTMINGISHDLRTPLTAVKGHIKGIQDGIANTPEKEAEYLAVAYERTLDIERLLARLFEMFNYETAELRLKRERTGLEEFLRKIAKDEKTEFRGEGEVFAEIDRVEMKRVIDNLIINARKHNAGKRDLQILVTLGREKKMAVIKVEDNGKGVKDFARIFDEFYTEDEARSRGKAGQGLGLFIAKQIVTAHGGTIEATKSELGGLAIMIRLEADV